MQEQIEIIKNETKAAYDKMWGAWDAFLELYQNMKDMDKTESHKAYAEALTYLRALDMAAGQYHNKLTVVSEILLKDKEKANARALTPKTNQRSDEVAAIMNASHDK